MRLGVIREARSVKCWWFDPRYGTAAPIYTGEPVAMQTFTPPASGRGQDWVLVLDDADKGFATPGSSAPAP